MIKNFLFVLKRFKTSSVLNILGLSVAFTAFMIILIQVNFEYSFEKCHPNAPYIYRVDGIEKNSGDTYGIHSRPFADAVIQSSPHIVAGTLINPYINDFYFTIADGDKEKGFKESFVTCMRILPECFILKCLRECPIV